MNVIRELGLLLQIRRNDSKGASMPFKRGQTSVPLRLIQRSGFRGGGRGADSLKHFKRSNYLRISIFRSGWQEGSLWWEVRLSPSWRDLRLFPDFRLRLFRDFPMSSRKIAIYVWHWCENGNQLFADDWDDNERRDSRQEVACLEEGWTHPPQHQPRHIGDDKAAKYLSFFNIWWWSTILT